ncbi:uncharacterized protein UV8b_04558 [Ustilaginoidea virens]|uniref:Succinate dehydrogenase assembly factor 3 n=1 Tax=Ustilaginoidea virens TaxID=1159556 RepID=A0A1B5KV05_USTVR|nr:uncharacterized protein UV8b_04558 [Ustilaginoidea virens]QUC20317.1 hypothetical protein UV8b_04558 [Ustilaginoidea virens]GAO14752.1 hypothetical protein UVI_02028370 [Ustilaginoidea virens]
MRLSPPRLAVAAQRPLRPQPSPLLAPIPLYRRLLRAHRKRLPADMRILGDEYLKAEFRLHRRVDNPAHLIGFLTEWQVYAQTLEGDAWAGDKMDEGKLAKMSDEQIHQLYELMRAIRSGGEDGHSDPDPEEKR